MLGPGRQTASANVHTLMQYYRDKLQHAVSYGVTLFIQKAQLMSSKTSEKREVVFPRLMPTTAASPSGPVNYGQGQRSQVLHDPSRSKKNSGNKTTLGTNTYTHRKDPKVKEEGRTKRLQGIGAIGSRPSLRCCIDR